MTSFADRARVPGTTRAGAGPTRGRRSPAHVPRPPWAPAPGPNRTGLPDSLKAGVEARSGLAMDDVRVHRNSPEPARLGALAFTRGSDIHLGPGQDAHLAHEAWHVVQQKQGRVAPTGRIAGHALNEDRGLEREADSMGAAALGAAPLQAPPPVSAGHSGDSPVQRKKTVYRDGSSLDGTAKTAISGIADTLDLNVAKATQIIFADPKLTSYKGKVGAGYVAAWAKTYAAMIDTASIPEFFYARYGYAVETLATAMMPGTVGNYAIETQYATGATRPDFVVWNAKKEDVAWLDITSSGSAGHILAKQHSGWSTRPYVAEILYDPPKISDFSASSSLSEDQKKALASIESKAVEEELDYQTGHDAIGPGLERSLNAAAEASKSGITKGAAKTAIWQAMKGLYSDITAESAGEVLRLIEVVTVGNQTFTGEIWANWAFTGRGYKTGRAYLIDYGGKIRRPVKTTTTTTTSNSNNNASSTSATAPVVASTSTSSTAQPSTATTTTTTTTASQPDVVMK